MKGESKGSEFSHIIETMIPSTGHAERPGKKCNRASKKDILWRSLQMKQLQFSLGLAVVSL